MSTREGYTNQEGTGDLRAPGGLFAWMGKCVSVGAVTRPKGALSVSHCRSAENAYGWDVFNQYRAPADMISFDVIAPKWKVALIEGRLEDCPHDVRKRYSKCLQPNDPDSWQLIEDYRNCTIENVVDSAGTIEIDGTGAAVLETLNMKALCMDRVVRIIPTRIGAGATTLNINAVRFCGAPSCGGECGDVNDGCQTFYAVTDSAAGYLSTPKLILATRTGSSWAFAYTLRDIDPFNAGSEHAEDLICLSNGRIIVLSPTAQALAYSDDSGVNWTLVALTAAPAAIDMENLNHIYVVGASGLISLSTDGGTTWDTIAAFTAQNLLDVHSYGAIVVAVGAANAIGISRDSGNTFDALTGPNPGIALNVVRCLGDREFLVGCADGKVYRTTDQGVTWSLVVDFASVLGAAASVVAWDFCGCLEDKGGVLVTSAAVSYVYRTIDHAMSFQVLRDDGGSVQQLPTNSGVNDIACCDVNVAVAVGEINAASGYMALLK